ncbi:hypothetical protein [Longimicrobium sp.]|uniref:hypothetical protein n=1 Tax=Longimicrobium sp. TaxID=2029185 RepID=UPI002E379137|nr:hypothetical protein [Longimicrobium sp.]HEX6041939.1 hypothetical protein [Longimicrobium sp.]
MSGTQSNAVPGYALAPPTADDALAYLARAVGPDRAAGVWLRACAAVGAPRATLSVDEMMRVSEHLAREQGVVGVIGQSLVVRVRTYRLLASAQQRAEGGR